MKNLALLLAAVLAASCSSAPQQPLGAPPASIRYVAAAAGEPSGYTVAATKGEVWETSIAISPANPFVAVAAGMEGVTNLRKIVQTFWTDDGGHTWHYSAPLPLRTASSTYTHQGDPVVAFDRTGVAYVVTLVGYPKPGVYERSGILLWRSTDGGRTWSEPRPVVERTRNYFDDKEWLGVDTSGGAYDGTLYVAWLRAKSNTSGPPYELMFTRSRDGGLTWTPERAIGLGGGPQFAIGPAGEVHITYVEGMTMKSITSRDGGDSFDAPVRIEELRGLSRTLPNTQIQLFMFPSSCADRSTGPTRGHLYTTWAGSANAYPARGSASPGTIWLSRSADAGRSWSAPVALSNPATGRDAMFPSVACDPASGQVVVAWLDRADDPENTVARIYAARSSDGGATFSAPRAFTSPVSLSNASFVGHYNGTAGEHGIWLTAFSDATGKMGVARLTFEAPPPPPSGPRRRAVRH